jgi:hypothetical protein
MADSGSSPKADPTTPGGAASRSPPASPSAPAPAHAGAGHLEVDVSYGPFSTCKELDADSIYNSQSGQTMPAMTPTLPSAW